MDQTEKKSEIEGGGGEKKMFKRWMIGWLRFMTYQTFMVI